MKRYETPISSVACGTAAIAMTAITIGALVVPPASMDANDREPRALIAAKAVSPEPAGYAVGSTNMEIVGAHRREPSTPPCTSSNPGKAPEG